MEELPLIQISNKELNRAIKAAERKKSAEEKAKERNKKKTAKQKKAKSGSATGGPFDFLIATNDWLEQVPDMINAAFDNCMNDMETITQSKVDTICTWLAWKVNIGIERVRQRVLKALHKQYESTVGGRVMQTAMAIKSFCSDPLGAIGKFASSIFAPVSAVLSWLPVLITEIPRLAANLANIVSALPPNPPNPHINYDKFKLSVGSVNMAMIAADPSSLPPPEVMFPEPEKPFSQKTFDNEFANASAQLKSSTMKYKLSKEDKATLMEMNSSMV